MRRVLKNGTVVGSGLDTQGVTAKRREGSEPAGENDDLLVLAGAAERIEHALDAVIVTIDQGVVENDRDDASPLGQHGAHRQTHENGDLLLDRAVDAGIARM